jgi:hypothetical protein
VALADNPGAHNRYLTEQSAYRVGDCPIFLHSKTVATDTNISHAARSLLLLPRGDPSMEPVRGPFAMKARFARAEGAA